jgi:predicted permease
VAWIGFVVAFYCFAFRKKYGWSKIDWLLNLNCRAGNTSFGFPIIEALYGQEGMKTAILVDQPGTFVVLSTLGIIVATMYSKGQIAFRFLKKLFFSRLLHLLWPV